jgi:hypothetical protein
MVGSAHPTLFCTGGTPVPPRKMKKAGTEARPTKQGAPCAPYTKHRQDACATKDIDYIFPGGGLGEPCF